MSPFSARCTFLSFLENPMLSSGNTPSMLTFAHIRGIGTTWRMLRLISRNNLHSTLQSPEKNWSRWGFRLEFQMLPLPVHSHLHHVAARNGRRWTILRTFTNVESRASMQRKTT
jgi:hypothetical protein